MAYVEEYRGQRDPRRHRKSSRRTTAPAAAATAHHPPPAPPHPAGVPAAGPKSLHFDDWRASHEKSQFRSPYRSSKPDIQSAESRSSSREWSRTDSSLRAAASTMPSSLHTTSRSSHRGAARGSVQYQRGAHPFHDKYNDYDDREDEYEDDDDGLDEDEEDDEDYYEARGVDNHPPPPRRRGGSRVAPSPRPSTHRSGSAHVPSHSKSYPNSRAHSSRQSLSESEDSGKYRDDGGHYDESEGSLSSSSDESMDSEEDKELAREAKMPTIHEYGTRDSERTKDRHRSKSSPRRRPSADDVENGYREEEDVVIVEETAEVHATPQAPPPPPPPPQSAIPDERDGRGAEMPPTHAEHPHPQHPDAAQPPHHPRVPREIVDEEPPRDDHYRTPRRPSRRSKSKYTDEERDSRTRRPRRKSHHTDPTDVEEDLNGYRRPRCTMDDEEDREREYRRTDRPHSHHPRHSAKARPASPPPHRSYSPERSRVGTSHKPRRRRSSMDDARPVLTKSRRHPSEDQIYATPSRKARTSGPHMASSYSVSTSKRSSSFLSNMLGLSHHPAPSPGKPPKQSRVECVICMDKLPSNELPRLKCGHQMCAACLDRLFKLSLTDPQHMPPKCCQDEIPLAFVNHLFDNKFKRKWNRKLTEYTMKNPTYCPAKKCNTLLTSGNIIKRKGYRCKMGICPKCHTEVCTTCKGRWHKSKTCPRDPEANKLLDMAKEEGWQMQKCYRCNSLVELKEGCNHMTCRCGAEFCMLCGQKWKKCDCPWFNYDDADDDGLDYLNIERPARNGNPFAPAQRPHLAPLGGAFAGRRPAPPMGHNPQQARPMSSHRPGSSHRAAPPDFGDPRPRRRRRDADEGVRRPLIADAYDDEYDILDDDMLDIVGLGNQTGHFMNDDYRMVMAMNGPPSSLHPPSLPRAATGGAAQLLPEQPRQKVRRHPSSMERRLADRFADIRPSLARGSGPHTAPPAPLSHIAPPVVPRMGPASALGTGRPPPMAPAPPPPAPMPRAPPPRRHSQAVDEEVYNETPTRRPRPSRAPAPEHMTHGYFEEPGDDKVSRQRLERPRSEPAKSSVLAGLTGQGRGMNRVFEWRTHVSPGMADEDSAVVVV